MWWKTFCNELVMTKDVDEDFENSTEFWICDNDYVNGHVKVRDYCHINGKYWGSAYRDCNINVKLHQKISAVFHNVKSYASHFIMQELGKYNLKINVVSNGLQKYRSFSINSKFSFIDTLPISKFFIG